MDNETYSVEQVPFNAMYGGIYLITLTQNLHSDQVDFVPLVDLHKSCKVNFLWLIQEGYVLQKFPVMEAELVRMYWQLPQYVVLTFAEVLVSTTGLDFAYSEVTTSWNQHLESIVKCVVVCK